jgi:hypothetical protein
VSAAVPAQSFQQFVALAKAKPESITFASMVSEHSGILRLRCFSD